jgi:hypothetical protein
MYWGDDYVPIRQARRALMTWIGDPRASKRRAREVATAILDQIDSPEATPRARRHLLDVLTQASYTGRLDFDQMERAIRDVFEPGYVKQIRKAVGHPSAPLMTDSMIGLLEARLTAVKELKANNVTDEALIQARDAHLFFYAEYVAKQPLLAVASPPGTSQLYGPVTAEDTIRDCCSHLLSAIGLEITCPDQAERLCGARSGLRRPQPAEVGLTLPRASPLPRPTDLSCHAIPARSGAAIRVSDRRTPSRCAVTLGYLAAHRSYGSSRLAA